MLFQKMQEMLTDGHGWDELLYLNFEDDRLTMFDVSTYCQCFCASLMSLPILKVLSDY